MKAKHHHYSTLQCAPFLANQANRDFFWYTDCIFKDKYLSLHKWELLRCLLRISDSGQNTCKGNKVRKCTYHNFSSSSHVIIKVMINTYQNSSWSFPLTKKWWYEHSATFPHPSYDKGTDIYIQQLFLIVPCYNELKFYKHHNFSSSFHVIIKWWDIHNAAFPDLSLL